MQNSIRGGLTAIYHNFGGTDASAEDYVKLTQDLMKERGSEEEEEICPNFLTNPGYKGNLEKYLRAAHSHVAKIDSRRSQDADAAAASDDRRYPGGSEGVAGGGEGQGGGGEEEDVDDVGQSLDTVLYSDLNSLYAYSGTYVTYIFFCQLTN